jgi:hypothetical protein
VAPIQSIDLFESTTAASISKEKLMHLLIEE